MRLSVCFIFLVGLFGLLPLRAELPDSLFIAQFGDEQLKDSTDEQRFDYHFYNGLSLQQNNRPNEAIQQFKRCLEINTCAAVYYELSRGYLAIGQTSHSFELLKQAVALDPKNITYKELMAGYHMAMKHYSDALASYEELHRMNPSSLSYLYALINLSDQLQNYKKTLSYFNELERLDGYNEDIAYARLNIYVGQNKKSKIEGEFKKLIDKYPSNPSYRVMLGDFYIEEHKDNKGLGVYHDVLADFPGNGYALLSLSNYYRMKNNMTLSDSCLNQAMLDTELDFEDKMEQFRPYIVNLVQQNNVSLADSIFQVMLNKFSGEVTLHEFYVEFLKSQKDTSSMIKEYRELIKIDRSNQVYWESLLQLLWSEPYLPEMLSFCTEAYDEFKSLTWGYYKVLSLMLNEDTTTIEQTEKILANHKGESVKIVSRIYGFLGDIYMTKDSVERAFQAYDSALALDFDIPNILNNYAYHLALNKQNLQRAEKMAARAIELEPNNVNLLDTYSWVFFMREDYRSAQFYIERAISYDDQSAVMFDHYGDILFMMGNTPKAMEMWQKAVDLGSDSKVLPDKIKLQKYIPDNEK